jgi:glutamine amidotransferase
VTIAILDYGAGNLPSVARACRACGATPRIVREPTDLHEASAIIVPGVGHFDTAARGIGDDWRRALTAHVARGRALFGICLGLQWLFESSDEAPAARGLGLLPGRSIRLPDIVKVPHVGWNTLDRTGRPSRLLEGLPPDAFVYFTHSYAVPVVPDAVATTTHGMPFTAVVESGCVFGTQFHPEKSGEIGLRMFANFVRAAASCASLDARGLPTGPLPDGPSPEGRDPHTAPSPHGR